MAGAVNKAIRAPGSITVGVDAQQKPYRYEVGGGRGRQPLNLSPSATKALQARGLAPGRPISVSAVELAALSTAGTKQPVRKQPSAKPQKSQRQLRAGVALATLLGMKHNPDANAQATGDIRILFHPGGDEGGGHVTLLGKDGQHLGGIEFPNLKSLKREDAEVLRWYYADAKEKVGAK